MTERESDGVIFGRRLRELRTERGLTLPGLAMLVPLASALDCSVVDLVEILDRGRATATKVAARRGRRAG